MNAAATLALWITDRDHHPERPLTRDTLLFAERRLTSLDLPELLLLLEELTERTLRIEDVTPEAFASLASIEERFL